MLAQQLVAVCLLVAVAATRDPIAPCRNAPIPANQTFTTNVFSSDTLAFIGQFRAQSNSVPTVVRPTDVSYEGATQLLAFYRMVPTGPQLLLASLANFTTDMRRATVKLAVASLNMSSLLALFGNTTTADAPARVAALIDAVNRTAVAVGREMQDTNAALYDDAGKFTAFTGGEQTAALAFNEYARSYKAAILQAKNISDPVVRNATIARYETLLHAENVTAKANLPILNAMVTPSLWWVPVQSLLDSATDPLDEISASLSSVTDFLHLVVKMLPTNPAFAKIVAQDAMHQLYSALAASEAFWFSACQQVFNRLPSP